MNPLRHLATPHKSSIGTFYMNPAKNPLIQGIVLAQLDSVQPYDANADKTNKHQVNNARSAFLIMEAFVIDVDWEGDSTLRQYVDLRGGATIADRWLMFTMMVTDDDGNILFEAFNKTRPKAVEEPETDSQKKQSNNGNSETSTPEASKEVVAQS